MCSGSSTRPGNTAGAPQIPGILHATRKGGAWAESEDELGRRWASRKSMEIGECIQGEIDFYEKVECDLCPVVFFSKMTTHKKFMR